MLEMMLVMKIYCFFLINEIYIIDKYFVYKIIDDKSISKEAHEVKNLLAKIVAKRIFINKTLQVHACSIFLNSLNHKLF